MGLGLQGEYEFKVDAARLWKAGGSVSNHLDHVSDVLEEVLLRREAALREENARLREIVGLSEMPLRLYAAAHPKWKPTNYSEQDPAGVHTLLAKIDAFASARPAPAQEQGEDIDAMVLRVAREISDYCVPTDGGRMVIKAQGMAALKRALLARKPAEAPAMPCEEPRND